MKPDIAIIMRIEEYSKEMCKVKYCKSRAGRSRGMIKVEYSRGPRPRGDQEYRTAAKGKVESLPHRANDDIKNVHEAIINIPPMSIMMEKL